jgi:hypothetical protein
VLVKDRGVDTREQVLNVLIAYWCYEPSKLMYPCNHLAETSLPYSKADAREGDEVTQDDSWVSLSSIVKTSLGCRGIFHPRGD